MRRPRFALVLLAVVSLAALAASCGGDPTNPALTPKPATAGSSPGVAGTTPTVNPTFGPPPEIKDNIEKLSPPYGAKVSQVSTRSPDPNIPLGVCVQVNFNGLANGNGQWFRVAFDGVEVTTKLIWSVDSFEKPTKGRVCYAPTEGFPVGRHFTAVSVQDPKNPAAPPKQVASWGFEVTP